MKGTTNAQRNAVVDSSYADNQLKLTYADGSVDTHTLASPIVIDDALSSTSTNPVQNKVVKGELDGKLGKTETAAKATADADGYTISTTYLKSVAASTTYLKQTDAASTYATQDALVSAIGSVYRYKNSVTNYSDLPSSGNTVGDVYNVVNAYGNVPAGTNWAWNGSAWDALAGTVDLTPFAKATDVANTYNTKVPASGTYDADTSTITFKAASGTQLFQITGIEGGGVSFTLKVTYTGAPDVSGISVTATPVTGATATVQGTTNSSGIAYLSVKQNATYKVTSSKTGYTFTSSPEVSCTDLTTETSISCYVPGTVTITVTDEKTSVVGRTVTATASGQTTQTKTISSGNSVTFSLPAATWTFTTDYPSGATGSTSFTQAVENNGTYSGTVSVVYNVVYGARIVLGTSDPSARVSYPSTILGQTNKAYGKTPASGTGASCMNDWDGCELISGIHRQKGSSTRGWTDIENTAAWQAGSGTTDIMTYVPTWYFKMYNDGTNIDFAFSMEKIDETWLDLAGSVGTNRVGHFRVGCFAGYVSSSNLYSRGSTAPTVSTSITDFISYAKARGTGYDIMTWYQWTYLAALAVLLYKSTDLQTAMAGGYVGGSAVQSETSLTWSNAYGMAGTAGTSSTAQMSFFWIQNLWGNMYQFVGGAKIDSSRRLMTCTGYSSVTNSDFDKTALSAALSSNISGYISKVTGTTETGFLPSECSGSRTTYFADYGFVLASSFPFVGGYYADGDDAGPFRAYFGSGATEAGAVIGSRLSYRL